MFVTMLILLSAIGVIGSVIKLIRPAMLKQIRAEDATSLLASSMAMLALGGWLAA